jgi:putative transposase
VSFALDLLGRCHVVERRRDELPIGCCQGLVTGRWTAWDGARQGGGMQAISYARHQFPAEVIRQAIWLYLRFTLSYRDVEELLAERGIESSYETVRRWVLKFGPMFARNLRRLRPRPTGRWHLDEMVVRIGSKKMYLWRAVDSEGEVLDLLVQPKRDTKAALRLMRKLLKKQGYAPDQLVTDNLGSYGAARRELRLSVRHEQGLRKNNRASLFGRLKSSAFRCSGARLQLSRGLLLLFGFGTLALPSWGRKNEVELSEKRPSASIRVRGACPVSNSPHSSSRKGQPSAQVRKLVVLLGLNTLNRPVYQAT